MVFRNSFQNCDANLIRRTSLEPYRFDFTDWDWEEDKCLIMLINILINFITSGSQISQYYVFQKYYIYYLSHDIAFRSDITPHIKTDKPIYSARSSHLTTLCITGKSTYLRDALAKGPITTTTTTTS